MSDYSYIYIVFFLILLAYSVMNRLDIMCIASVCYLVYTIYCIPGIGISGQYRPYLSASLYYAVYCQMAMMIIFVIAARYHLSRKKSGLPDQPETGDTEVQKDPALKLSFRIYTAVIFAFAILNIASVGFSGFAAGKSIVWEQTNVLYIIALYGAWPAFAYGIHNRDKLVWIPALFIELTIFFAGSRAFTATIIIIFLCEKATELWKKGKGNLGLYMLGGAGVVFLLLYRMIDQMIMEGDMNAAMESLKDPATWLTALEFNEPRVIIANYDYAFTSGLRLPAGDIIFRFLDFIPGLPSALGLETVYPEYYSDWLLSQVQASAGVGGSIWGETYSMFGYIGIIAFTIVWLLFMYFSNRHLDYHEKYSYFIVSLGIYLAWYINRLDFNRVAQACKIMLFCFLLWGAAYVVLTGVLKIGKIRFVFDDSSPL